VSQADVSTSDLRYAGMQCTCTSLIYLCVTPDYLSPLLKPTSSDVDQMVYEGTELYQRIIANQYDGKPRYLMIDELPQAVVVRGRHYSVKKLEIVSGLTGTSETNLDSMTFSLEDALKKTFAVSRACFLTLGNEVTGYTIAVRKFDSEHYWSFDSHSRNIKGTCATAGKAVIMEAMNLTELATYIRELGSSLTNNADEMPFELVTVDCVSTTPHTPATGHEDRSQSPCEISGPTLLGKPVSDEATKVESNSDNNISVDTVSEQNEWPIIWSEKCEKYKFLLCNNGRLGCMSCRAVSGLQAFSAQGRHLAAEWVNCQITANGKGRREQLTSLRKKIFEHSKSSAHNSAETILRVKKEERMEKLAEKMSAEDEDLACKSFRTAYHLAKRNRPFSDYQSLLELQELNGANIGIGLRSRYSATQIVMHVSEEMRRRACKQVIEIGSCFSVLVDESTTVSNKSTLIVYLKCITNENTEPHLIFLQLLELDDQKATTITQALLNCLHHFGFTDDYMRDHLVAFVSDGASVMTGRKSGVAAQLTDIFPKLVTWHCLNHRSELAVGDAADET